MHVSNSEWRTSSYSGPNGDCVALRPRADHGIDLRDSKRPGGPVMTFGTSHWTAFATALRNGTLPAR